MKQSNALSLRLLAKNTAIYALGNLVQRAAAFIPIPLYTYYLAVAEYGQLEIFLVAIQLLGFLVQFGMVPAYLRYHAEHQRNGDLGRLIGSTLMVNGLAGSGVMILTAGIAPALISQWLGVSIPRTTYALAGGIAILQNLQLQLLTYYRSNNEGLKYMGASLASTLLVISAIFVGFQLATPGLNCVLLALTTAHGLMLVVLSFLVLRRTGVGLSLRIMRRQLSFGFPLIFMMCGYLMMTSADRYFLGYFAGLTVVGLYTLGLKVSHVLDIAIAQPFQTAYLPYIFAGTEEESMRARIATVLSYLLLGSSMAAFGVVVLARDVIDLLGPPAYQYSYIVTLWTIPTALIHGLYIWVTGILQVVKRTRIIGAVAVACAGLNVILDLLWIPRWGWHGAVLATITSSLISITYLSVLAWRSYPVPVQWHRVRAVLLMSLCMLILSTAAYSIHRLIGYAALLLMPVLPVVFGFFTRDELTGLRRRIRGHLSKREDHEIGDLAKANIPS